MSESVAPEKRQYVERSILSRLRCPELFKSILLQRGRVRRAAGLRIARWSAIASVVQLVLMTQQPAMAELLCPRTLIRPTHLLTPVGPLPSQVVYQLFELYYSVWRTRIGKPDIALSSHSGAWTQVPEFGKLTEMAFLPFVLDKLKAGDIYAVRIIECITGIDSLHLYPPVAPPFGQFSMNDVAALWVTDGGQVYESRCKARCAGNGPCEQMCVDKRILYWGP